MQLSTTRLSRFGTVSNSNMWVHRLPRRAPGCVRLLNRGPYTKTLDPLQCRFEQSGWTHLRAGAELSGYVLLHDISKRSDGTLWLVEEAGRQGPVMVGRLLPADDHSEAARWRVIGEAKVRSEIAGRSCSRVIDCRRTEGGDVFLVTELVTGTSVSDYVEHGLTNAGEFLQLLCDICDVFDGLHRQGCAGIVCDTDDLVLRAERASDTKRVCLVDFRLEVCPGAQQQKMWDAVERDLRRIGVLIAELAGDSRQQRSWKPSSADGLTDTTTISREQPNNGLLFRRQRTSLRTELLRIADACERGRFECVTEVRQELLQCLKDLDD